MVIMIGFFLGLRRQEICGIKVKDFRLFSGKVYIRRSIAKMGSSGYVHILSKKFTDEMQDHIKENKLGEEDYILSKNGKPYSTKHMSHFAGEAFDWTAEFHDNLEFEDFYTHSLRHGFARWMEMHGYPPKFISSQMRHAKTSITQDMYGHLNQRDMENIASTGAKAEW